VPAPRADLRFGRDDLGRIYLLTKRDGVVRRLVPSVQGIPALGGPALLTLTGLIAAAAFRLTHRA